MNVRRTWLAMAVLGVLAGCAPDEGAVPGFNNTEIGTANYGKTLEATDHLGQPRSLADFRGKVVTLFFGYTQCPDICPTNLLTMSEVMKQLGPLADQVQVLFMTVDPERDTAALLREYVPVFDPRFLGLHADPDRTAEIAKEFRVIYRKSGDLSGMHYTVDHSTGTYVYDPAGRLRLYVRHGETPERIAADIRRLLAETGGR